MRNEITNAVRRFGETSHNIVIKASGDVAAVHVDHEHFGIYSFTKKTFVD